MYTGHWDCHHPGTAQGWHDMAHHWHDPATVVVCEIAVDSTTPSKDAMVGSLHPVRLSVEYLVETGATSPSVTVTTSTGTISATWSDSAPPVGYTVQQAILNAASGTKVTLAASNAIARLRWCETVCC